MLFTGYVTCYLQEQNLNGDWMRAGLLLHCTACGVQNSFLLQWVGTMKLRLWGKKSKKELKLYFTSHVIKRGEDHAGIHKPERDL